MTPAITIPPRSNGETNIWIKGTRKGLSITLGEGDWSELLHELDLRLSQADAFFRGSQVNLSTGKRDLDQTELKELMDTLLKHDIKLISLRTGSEAAAEAAQSLGVRLGLPEATLDQMAPRTSPEEPSEGLLLRRTLRSGQSIRHPGHVVIIGDVNPGAEIIAGGDVVVWGKLRGMVHAGALGDNGAVVCALELMPTQLRIGTHIATSPEEKKSKGIQPEVAFVLNDRIVAEPWSGK
jgi:septum site-determining protein MinC